MTTSTISLSSRLSRRKFAVASISAGALMPLAGCKTLGILARQVLKDPKVAITNMQVRSATLEALDTIFSVNVTNPNAIALALQGLDYSLDVEGKRFADGKTEKALKLPANGSETFDFPVRFPLGDTVQVIMETLQRKEVNYVLGSVFHFGAKDFQVAIPVEFPGVAPVPKPPVVGVRELRIVGVGPTGVGLRLSTWVQNPNLFDIPLDKLGVNLTLNKRKSLSAVPVRSIQLPSQKTRDVDIDFSVDLASLGLSVIELASRPVLDWKVGVDLESGALKFPFEQVGSVRLVP